MRFTGDMKDILNLMIKNSWFKELKRDFTQKMKKDLEQLYNF